MSSSQNQIQDVGSLPTIDGVDNALLGNGKRGKFDLLSPSIKNNSRVSRKRAALANITNAGGSRGRQLAAAAQAKVEDRSKRGESYADHPESLVEQPATKDCSQVRAKAHSPPTGWGEEGSSAEECDSIEQQQSWKNVDEQWRDDPQMCTQYVGEIYSHLQRSEKRYRPSPSYMDQMQKDINPTMRGILVDWLVEVAEEYKLLPDTLYLAVDYIDCVLSKAPIMRNKLQLVGVSCMLIAAKYEEIYPPQVDEFCYITDNTYKREEVLSMERKVLEFLDFQLTKPTTKSFLRRFVQAAEVDTQTECLASFLAELSLLEYSFLQFLPSTIAASSVFLARLTMGKIPWTTTLVHYTGYAPADLQACIQSLHKAFLSSRQSQLPAIREKYSLHKFQCVSAIVPPRCV